MPPLCLNNKQKAEQTENSPIPLKSLNKDTGKVAASNGSETERGEYRESWLTGEETDEQKLLWEPVLR